MDIKKSLFSYDKTIEKSGILIPGEIGTTIFNKRVTSVPNRGQFVYVRLRSNQSEVIQAFNDKVFPGYGIPVLVKWNNTRYEVVSRDTQRYPEWEADNPQIAKHGATHSLDKENDRMGTDPVWVYPYQFMPSLVSPFPVNGVQNVYINPHTIYENGRWRYLGNTGTPSLSGYRPHSGSAVVLITIDSQTGNPALFATTGSYIPPSVTGTSQFTQYIPLVDEYRYIPLSYIHLQSGTTSITWDNITDVRQFTSIKHTGSSFLSVNDTPNVNAINFTSGANIIVSGTKTFLEIIGVSDAGGGIPYPFFGIDGALETGTSQSQPYLVTDDFTANFAYLYLENLGTTGTTKVDILKNGISIFTGGYTLQIPYDSTGSWVRAAPYFNTFVLGDILTLSVVAKANGAGNALSMVTSSSASNGAITVGSQGGADVLNVSTLNFPSGSVTNLGGGEVQVQFPVYREQIIQEIYITGSAFTTINISNIPQNFRNLKLEVVGRGSTSSNVQVRMSFNGVSGTSYSFDRWNKFGSTNSVLVGYIEVGDIVMNTAPMGAMSSFVTDIFDYTRGSYKNVMSVMSSAISVGDVSMTPQLSAGLFKNTNPVTSISLTPSTGQFLSGTVVVLSGRF